jgi:hypothetical protein
LNLIKTFGKTKQGGDFMGGKTLDQFHARQKAKGNESKDTKDTKDLSTSSKNHDQDKQKT